MKSIKTVAFLVFTIIALSCIFILRNSKADVVKSKYFNYVEKGAKVVKTSPSTQYKLMETYPQSTVTVYDAGTTDLASLWSDRDGLSIKANPFTADTDSFYYFYVDCGKYDIKFSGTGISVSYTYGDVTICGNISSGTGNVETLGGTADFIAKFTSATSIGDSSLYNPSNIQASSSILFGWTSGLATASLDVAIGRDSAGKLEINSGILNDLRDLTLHRIEPIPTATIPGLNFGVIANDPSAPVEGDCWYNSSLSAFRCFIGSTVTLSTGNGITSINALTAAAQLLTVGTSGSDFNISSTTATHTFNLPDAGLAARGVVTTGTQSFNGDKTFDDNILITSNIANSFLYSDSTKAVQTTSAPVNGQLLIGSTGNAPVVANLVGDSNIDIINTAGGIQIICITCGASGGTTINPTDTVIPYRLNATTFADSPFYRTDANTIEQRNSTNRQTTNLYGTFTSASVYKRLSFTSTLNNGNDIFSIAVDSSDGLSRNLKLSNIGNLSQYVILDSDGHFKPTTGNTSQELGSATAKWGILHEISTIKLYSNPSQIQWVATNNGLQIQDAGDGTLLVTNNFISSGGTIAFGATSSPTQLTGNQVTYLFTGGSRAYLQKLTSNGSYTIAGLDPSISGNIASGEKHLILNGNAVGSGNDITLNNEDAAALSQFRMNNSISADIVLEPNKSAECIYDNTITRWYCYKNN